MKKQPAVRGQISGSKLPVTASIKTAQFTICFVELYL